MNLLDQFISILQAQKPTPSVATVKNYKADIAKFIRWFEATYQRPFEPSLVNAAILKSYEAFATSRPQSDQNQENADMAAQTSSGQGLALKSFERHLSSLRKFFNFLKVAGHIQNTPFEQSLPADSQPQTDPYHLKDFKDHLYVFNASDLTIKNYIIDVKQFISWAEKVTANSHHEGSEGSQGVLRSAQNDNQQRATDVFKHISTELIEEYKTRLHQDAGLSPLSINRKLSSLRRFVNWTAQEGYIKSYQNITIANTGSNGAEEEIAYNPLQNTELIQPQNFATDPKEADAQPVYGTGKEEVLATSRYSKIPPIRLIQKISRLFGMGFEAILIAPLAAAALKLHLLSWALTGASVFQKQPKVQGNSAAQKLLDAANKPFEGNPLGILKVQNFKKEFYAPMQISTAGLPVHKKAWHHMRHTRPNWYRRYHQNPIVHYFHFAILIVVMTSLGVGMYQAFLNDPALRKASAAPSSPLRILSFQGRLTDTSDNPITTPTQLRFMIYNDSSASGGARLWEEVRTVSPDSDGIFSILLGSDGSGGNATLCNGGSPPSSPATGACGIPQALFGDNPALWLGITVLNTTELAPRQQIATVPYATNAELLQGMAPITQVGAGTTNVVLALDSSGNLTIGGSATPTFQATGGQFTLSGAGLRLITTTGSNANITIAPDGQGLIDLRKPVFNSTNNDNITSAIGAVEVDDLFAVLATSSGQSAFTLNQDGAGPILSASASGVAKFTVANNGQLSDAAYTTAGGILYGTAAGLITQTAAGTSAQCLLGGVTPTFGSCGGYWDQRNGSLYPVNSTVDLLIGGQSTASAKFSVLNVNIGTPTASVSSGVGGAGMYMTADGTLATTNRQTLTIGNSSLYNTNGNVLINPNGTGNVGIGLSNPGSTLQVGGTNADAILVDRTMTNTSNPSGFSRITGMRSLTRANPSGASNAEYDGMFAYAESTSGNGQNITGSVIGIAGQARHRGTATLNNLYGLNFPIDNASTGTVTNAKGIQVTIDNGNASGTISNAYGMSISLTNSGTIGSTYGYYAGTLKAGTQTSTPFSFYASDSNAFNYFAGNVGIGNGRTAPSATLDIAGSATLSATLSLGPMLQVDAGACTVSTAGKMYYDALQNSYYFCNGSSWIQVGSGSGVSWFTMNNGMLYPINTTLDFAIGGTSTSTAKFAVLNMVGGGTPTATIAGNISLGGPAGTIRTIGAAAMNALQLGDATTGDLLLAPGNSTAIAVKTGGNVGIGTTTPGFNLEVAGTTRFDGNTTIGDASGDSLTINAATLSLVNASTLDLVNSQTSALNIEGGLLNFDTTNSRIGIGTTTPTAKLDVNGAASISGSLSFRNGAGSIVATQMNDLTIGDTATGKVIINPSGNIGIGLTNPAAKLDILGTLKASGVVTFSNYTTNGGLLYTNGSGVIAQTNAGSSTQCLTGGTTPSFTTCPGYWDQQNGTLYPLNSTVDLLIGGQSTTSAKFAVLNVNTGVPTASVSALGVNNIYGAYLTADGTLATTNKQTLTLGGGTTGNIVLGSNIASNVLPAATNTYDLGSPALQWNNIYGNNIYSNGQLLTSLWDQINGALSPKYASTVDLLIGGQSTASAKFAFINVNSGTPTASISGNLAIAAPTGANPATTFSALNGGTINFQRSAGGDAGLASSMFINKDGNVGIGESAPIAKLHLGTTSETNPLMRIYSADNNNYILTYNASGQLTHNIWDSAGNGVFYQYAAGTLKNVISSSFNSYITGGNLGVGTTTPTTFKIETAGSIGPSVTNTYDLGSLTRQWNNVYANQYFENGVRLTNYWDLINGALMPKQSTADLLIGGTSTNSAKFAVLNMNSGTPTATVAGNFIVMPYTSGSNELGGNVGIGITNPTSPLYVNSILNPNGADTYSVRNYTKTTNAFASNTAYGGYYQVDANQGSGTANQIVGLQGLGTNASNNPVATAIGLSGGAEKNSSGGITDARGLYSYVLNNAAGTIGSAYGVYTELKPSAGTLTNTYGVYVGDVTSGTQTNQAFSFYASDANALNYFAGNVGINTTTPGEKLDVSGNATVSGNLTLYGGARSIQTTLNNTLTIGGASTGNIILSPRNGSGDTRINGTITLNTDTYTFPTGGTQSSGYVLTTNGSGTLTWADPGSSSTNFWLSTNGTLYPKNSTLDLFIGGQSTASAKFAVLNMNTGTPVASISSGVNGSGAYLTAAGLLATTRRQSLILGDSNTGDLIFAPTGSTALVVRSSGNVGINNQNPLAPLDVTGNASISATLYLAGGATSGIQTVRNQTLNIGGNTTGDIVLNPRNGSGNIFLNNLTTNGGVLYTDTAGMLKSTSTGSTLQCLLGGGGTPIWGSCASGGDANWTFDPTFGVLYNNTATGDVLIGANSTASAKFAVLNVAGTTPIASVSSGLNGTAMYMTADGTLATTRRQSLIIGNSSTYNTTGNVLINPNGTGNVGIGTLSPAAKLDITSANLNTGINLTYTNTNNADNNAFAITNTANPGTIASGTRTIRGIYNSFTPTVTSTEGSVGIEATNNTLDLSNLSEGTSTVFRNVSAYGDRVSITGAPTINDGSNASGTPLNVYGYQATVNVVPTITAVLSGGFNTFGGNFSNSSNYLGNANTAAAAYGIYASSDGNLTTTGNNSHYAGHFTAMGTADNNYGLYVNQVSTATNNYGLYINTVAASANNWAIFSNATAQSYIAGNVGIGRTAPSMKLDVLGSATISATLSLGPMLQVDAGACSQSQAGKIYYDAANTFYYCNASAWTPFATGTGGTNWWQMTNGSLYPINSTLDFFIGGQSTASANFAVLNNNSGIPVSSVSGNLVVMPKLGGGGNIGIGTSNPTSFLALNRAGGNEMITFTDGAFSGGIGYPDNLGQLTFQNWDKLLFKTGSNLTERMRIQSDGNIGIGTTAPLAALQVGNVKATAPAASVSANSNSFAGMVVDNAGTGDIFTASASGQNRFVIKNNGNVGVGTTNPSNAVLQVGNPGGTGSIATSVYYDVDNTNYFWDGAATGTSMVVNGSVGVGTTSPLAKLDVRTTLGTAPAASFSARSNSFAGMVINQDGLGAILTASTSGATRFTVTNLGDVIAAGQIQMGNYTSAQAATLNPVGRGALYYNTDLSTLFISNDGTTWTSLSGQNTVPLTNQSGGSMSQYSIVILDLAHDSSFVATTSAYDKHVIGVTNSATCASLAVCLVTVSGKTSVRIANNVNRGDYLYTSTTAGQAYGSSAQKDGMLGVALTGGSAGGTVDVELIPQLSNTATATVDRGSKHNEYRILSQLYTPTNEGTSPNTNITPRGIYFDNFMDNSKLGTAITTGGPWQAEAITPPASTAPNTPTAPYRVGLTNGQTYNSSNTDNNGLTYLSSNTVNKIAYYDRTRDSSPATQVNLGIDPNWYNGVTLSVASTSSSFSQNDTNPNQQVNPNLSTSYNGSVVLVSGQMSTSVANPAKTVYMMVKSTTATTITFDWSDGSVGKNGNTFTFGQSTQLQTGGGTNTGVFVTFMKANYNTGDVFRIASWYIENTTGSTTRGGKAQFPERSYIVAESDSADIIDADTQKLWMRFSSGLTNMIGANAGTPVTLTSVYPLNGEIYVSTTGNTSAAGLKILNFQKDTGYRITDNGYSGYSGSVAQRNVGLSFATINTSLTLATAGYFANDVAAAVIPNQPTQTVTIRGWGYINGASANSVQESVYLPYKFNNTPIFTSQVTGTTTSTPAKLSDCSATSLTANVTATIISPTTSTFTQQISLASSLGTSNYCYSWTATGEVSPRQFVAVAEGSFGSDGATNIINDTDQSSIYVSNGATHANTIWSNHVALASDGTLYNDYSDASAGQNGLGVYYGIAGFSSSESTINDKRWGLYQVGVGNSSFSNGGPSILGTNTPQQITSLSVTNGTSTIDGKSNTIYVGTKSGLSVIQEKQSHGNIQDGSDETNGSVKYYTANTGIGTYQISEEMVGDIRGMWPLVTGGSDVSIKGTTLTSGGFTSISGVRGAAMQFNGSSQFLVCTDGGCGGTSKLDSGGTTWSVGAWVKPNSVSGNQAIIAKENSAANTGYMLWSSSGVPQFRLNSGLSGTNNVSATTTMTTGKWYYVVGTYDGANIKIYVNGNLEGTFAYTSAIADDSANFDIAARGNGTDLFFNGGIDEAFVTATTIPAQYIKHMYNVGYRALQSHSTSLGGSSADTNQQLGGSVNMIADAKVDFNNQYMYVSTSDNNTNGGGRVSKIDLNSDTNVKTFSSSANTPTGGTSPVNNTNSSLAVGYNLEAVSASTSGVMSMAPDDNANATSGNFVSQTYTTSENFTQAYVWVQAQLDSQDASNTMTISLSNDGGTTFTQCNQSLLDTTQTPPEYEYFCQLNSSGNSLQFKAAMARGSTKTSTFITRYGIAWVDANAQAQSQTGNGFYTNTNSTVANGSYLELAHNQGTNDLITNGWVFDNGVWKQLDGSYTAAYSWDGKDNIRNDYHNEELLYSPTNETNANLQDTIDKGMLFDTFEDASKLDATNSASAILQQYKEDNTGLPAGVGVGQGNRIQKGRVGLTGGMTYNASNSDSDSHTYLGSNTVNKIYYYDRPNRDSSPATLVNLGIDPNWYNGVTLSVATTSSQFSQNDTNPSQSNNPHLSTTYNGALVQAQGRYSSNARPIFVTINSASGSATFNWSDYNGNSGTNWSLVTGQWISLAPTGVSIKFTGGVTYNTGDVFRIASWYTEPTGSTRGSKQSFPERSYVIAESSAVDIIDADTQKLWMKFTGATGNMIFNTAGYNFTSTQMLNGFLYVGLSAPSDGALYSISFPTDSRDSRGGGGALRYNGGISQRNSAVGQSSSNYPSIVAAPVNDIAAAVIPNQPKQTMTVSGWGYQLAQSNAAGGVVVSEDIKLPYKFNTTPHVTISQTGVLTTVPNTIDQCSSGGAVDAVFSASTITSSGFHAYAISPAGGLAAYYICYRWTATGEVSPHQYIAVATGNSQGDGGTTVINETDQSSINMSTGSLNASNIRTTNVALANDGTLYEGYENSTAQANLLLVYYGVPGLPTEASTNQYMNGYYGMGIFTSSFGGTTTAPVILSSNGFNSLKSLTVTSGTSTIDGKSNTIYVGTDAGLSVIQEKQSHATTGDGGDEANGSVKYYKKDYISEEMVGDIRGMWPLSANGALSMSDASVKADTLTNNNGVTATTGVRGVGASFTAASSMSLSCTDGSCGGTTKTDIGTGTWSLGAWVKTSTAGTRKMIISKGNAGANYSYTLEVSASNASTFSLHNTADGTYASAVGVSTVTDGNWHYIVGTWNPSGTSIKIYVDGRLEGSSTSTTGSLVTDSTANFMIGGRADGVGYMNGSIDEPFVTANELSGQYVKHMYEVGYRALQSHGGGLGGGSVDANQQLGGALNMVADARPDYNNQFMYVSTADGAANSNNGVVTKVDLNSDTNVKTFASGGNTPSGGTTPINKANSSLAVGYDLEAVSASASGVQSFVPSNASYTTTGTAYSKVFALPQNISSAVVWVKGWLDSSDSSSALTVSATANGGVPNTAYDTCTLVSTDNSGALPEKEYACDLSSTGNNLQMKFDFARQSVSGGTNSNNYITDYGVSWLGQSGFKIEQTTNNTIRLYNYSGISQNLRLDAITGTTSHNNGYISLAPAAADVDSGSFTNSIWLNKTGDGGTLLKLQKNGSDVFTITPSATNGTVQTASLAANFNPMTDNTYTLGSSPSARWKDLYLGPTSLHMLCKAGDGAGCASQTLDWSMGINTANGNFQIMPNGTASNNTAKFIINQDGNVGIGTTSAIIKQQNMISSANTNASLLTNTDIGLGIYNTNTTANNLSTIAFGNSFPAGQAIIGSINLGTTSLSGGSLFFATRTPSASGIAERMRIDSNGNVGIATTNPLTKFQVNYDATLSLGTSAYGSIHIVPTTGTNDNYMGISFGANNNGSVLTNTQAGIYVQSSSAYGTKMRFATTNSFATGAQERMVLDYNGNLGIGTTAPTATLQVAGTGYITKDFFVASASAVPSQTDNMNLATNASFETNASNGNAQASVDGWSLTANGTGTAARVIDDRSSGAYSIKMTSSDTSSSYGALTSGSFISVKPSTVYTFGIDAKHSGTCNNGGFFADVLWYDQWGNFISQGNTYAAASTTTSWASYTGTLTSPATAYKALLQYYNYLGTSSGTCTRWYDNAVFHQTGFDGAIAFATTNGNVGIGTVATSNKLHVLTSTSNDGIYLAGNSSTWAGYYANLGTGSYNGMSVSGDRGIIYGGASAGSTGGGFVIAPWSSTTGGIRLDSGGNLGIGTTAPNSSVVQIYGGNDSFTQNQLHLSSGTGSTSEYAFFGANSAGDYLRMGYYTGSGFGGTKFEGNVGIGAVPSASYNFYTTTARTDGGWVAFFQNNSNNAAGNGILVQAGSSAGGSGTLEYFERGDGTNVGSITHNGTNTGFNTSSDIRLKENITPSSKGLTDLMQINVADYNFISDPSKRYTGYLAQQLYTVFPDAVHVPLNLNDPLHDPWQVDYGRITPLIVKSVQELNNKVDANDNTNSLQIAQLNSNLSNVYTAINASTNSAQLASLTQAMNNLNLASTDFVTISPNATPSATRPYMATDSFGNPYTNAAAYAQAAIANLRAGSIEAEMIKVGGQTLKDYIIAVVQNAGFSNSSSPLIAPIAMIDRVYTNALSPLPTGNGVISIDGNLQVNGAATISGKLTATTLQTETATIGGTLTASQVQSQDGIFNGTLRARNIVADNIEGLQATIATMAATTITNITNVYNSTPSGSSIYASDDATHSALLAALATLPNGNLASASGTLNLTTITSDFATFNQGLIALGPSSFTDVSVAGQFSVGGMFTIADNAINVLGQDLALQPLRQGGISIMGGIIHIDSDGNVNFGADATFAKDIHVNGKIFGRVLSPIPDEDLVIQLGNDALPTTSQFKIKNSSGSAVLAVNQNGDVTASGAGTFAKLNLSIIKQAVATGAGDLISFGSAGVATISATRSEITIHNNLVTKDSLIYITPVGTPSGQAIYLMRQKPGDSFTVGGAAGAIFNWLIVN